ncbi:MAG: hypothetical protein U5K27_04740 [Desulfotignum sp.]|nr:hypothetical protein [Desulfotignum sp.]
MSKTKLILTKALKLDQCIKEYDAGKYKEENLRKFEAVWGAHLASHFLLKYNDAESLIWALI